MPGLLDKTTSALAYELAGLHDGPPSGTYPNYNDILRFVARQMDLMPGFLGLAIKAATLGFASSRLLVAGAFFHQEESSRRKAHVEAWRRSKLGPCRDLMKFYSSLVVLALYSRPASDRSRDPAG
jgi:hypothetical protein